MSRACCSLWHTETPVADAFCRAGSMTLLKRIAEVEEVANIVAFVASPGAGWITGNQIPANGGAAAMLQS